MKLTLEPALGEVIKAEKRWTPAPPFLIHIMPHNALILEEASLQIVPRRMRKHPNCIAYRDRFGLEPEKQILDENFHHELIRTEGAGVTRKAGRPDVVHFALLDVISTPLFLKGEIDLFVHTLDGKTIGIRRGTRLPRTLHRFCGLMSKILSAEMGSEEAELFDYEQNETIGSLLKRVGARYVVSLTKSGVLSDLEGTVAELSKRENGGVAWIVGGFAFGHFQPEVIERSDLVISISDLSLPAHVVTARLSYEIEKRVLSI